MPARGLSQAQLATLVGAAQKAVVYQWEARKRRPSPLFWQRLTTLFTTAAGVGALIQRGGRAVAGMLTIATAGGS